MDALVLAMIKLDVALDVEALRKAQIVALTTATTVPWTVGSMLAERPKFQ